MPTLNLPDNWAVWPVAIGQILTDPAHKRPGELAEIMARKAKIRTAKRLGPTHPFYRDYAADILDAADDGERIKDYLNDVRREFKAGEVWRPSMAAVILLLGLHWDTTGERRVSLTAIYDKIAEACENRIKGAQERELKRSWKYHRPTAHLWATWLLFQSEWPDICRSHQRLLSWLAHAEALRRLGGACRLWRSSQHERLLDLNETWCLLPSDPLPKVSVRIPSHDAIISAVGRMSEQN